jgi:hypothetical protein
MARRTIRITTQVNVRYKVELRRRITYQMESRSAAVPLGGAPVPRQLVTSTPLTSTRRETIYSAPLGPIRRAADEYTESLPDAPSPEDKPFDCFVCYAIPDEKDVVSPLVDLLRAHDLTVWAGIDLTIGSPLGRKIDQGLRSSRFGVVVLSPAFFAGEGWRRLELDALMSMEAGNADPVILPVWHNVTKADVSAHSPILAGKLARRTDNYTLEQIALEIAQVARA